MTDGDEAGGPPVMDPPRQGDRGEDGPAGGGGSPTADSGEEASGRDGGLRTLGRRPVLASIGAAVAGAAFVGDAGAAEYGTIVDVVDEGADDSGVESVTPVLYECRDQYGDDTLLKFPPGEYHMDAQFRATGFSDFGIVGDDATIVPADYHNFDGPRYRLFRLGVADDPGRNLQFGGFTIDQTDDQTGIRVVEAVVEDELDVAAVRVTGIHDSGTWGPARFVITERGGSGRVERFRAPHGAVPSHRAPGDLDRGPTGILVDKRHLGTLEFRDCVLGGFPDNGLYASTYGTVRVIGGHYRNSDTASIRLGGYGCLVRGTRVTVDRNPWDFVNQRGIRLEAGQDFRVDDVTVDLPEPNGHAITVGDNGGRTRIEDSTVSVGDRVNHGIVIQSGAHETLVFDTDVEIDGGGNAVQVQDGDGRVVLKRMLVWGKATGRTFRHAIRLERDGAEVRKCKIWQPGPDQRRAVVFDADDCLLYDSVCRTRHHPVLVNGDGAWIEANYLDSYDDYAAIRLDRGSSNATIKENTLVDGVYDEGSAGLRMYGNEVV